MAERARRGPSRSRWVVLVAALAAGPALVATATAWDGTIDLGPAQTTVSGATDAGPGSALVGSSTLACPGSDQPAGTPVVSAAAAPDGLVRAVAPGPATPAGADDDGAVSRLLVLGQGPEGRPLPGAGDVARVAPDEQESVLLRGVGATAPGPVAAQVDLGLPRDPEGEPGEQRGDGPARGFALTACTIPQESTWLVAGGGEPGRTEHLVLTNPGGDPVTVRIEVHGQDGPLPVTGGQDVVVPAGGRVVRLLDALAAGDPSPVLHVSATGGPVAAHLADTHLDGTIELGRDLAAASAGPATDLVVPLLPETMVPDGGPAADRTLRLVAPGEETVVQVTALTEDGLGGTVLAAPVVAGGVLEVALDDLPEGTAGLRLRSDRPVTGATLTRVAPDGQDPIGEAAQGEGALLRPAGDLAWAGATELSRQPVGITLPDTGQLPGARTQLALTVLDAAAVELWWLGRDGEVDTVSLDLVNDSSRVLEPPPGAVAVWVRPSGAAGVAAALHLGGQDPRGPFLASTTLPHLSWTQDLLRVVPALP